jgi:hypothetical protein
MLFFRAAVLCLSTVFGVTVLAGSGVTGVSGRARSSQAVCGLRARVVFWTASDWVPLAEELQEQVSPCTEYYISIPPASSDKTALRTQQDEAIRAIGPQLHPLAEVTLGGETGWAAWVSDAPGRTWFDAGVEFRRRMAQAGYRPELGEVWLLNEFDRSTRRDEEPYSRRAMIDLLRGLYEGDGTGPKLPGVVEIGIQYTHQNIPDVEGYKREVKAWLEDSAFWRTVDPYIAVLTKEVYPDARLWGVPRTPRNLRARHLTLFMEHMMSLVRAGPPSIGAAKVLFDRAYMPLANATWPARGPDPYAPPFCCGHGWTLMPLDSMLRFVSEQIYSIRRYVGNHAQGPPRGRLGFSWQPTNNFDLPPREWDAAKRAIASRIGTAIRLSYRPGLGFSSRACVEPASSTDWCGGADVPGAAFTDAWRIFERWNE